MSVVPAEKKLTDSQLEDLAHNACIDVNVLKAFCEVEGSGIGFSDVTGLILIQFEPKHFQKDYADWEQHKGIWFNNGVSNQTKEWAAFTDAKKYDEKAALLSTSIGEMQVMGFNFSRCEFKTVEEMWAYNEVSEANQVETGVRFIMSDSILYKALKNKNWEVTEDRYNGYSSRALATKLGVPFYSTRMKNAFTKFTNQANGLHKTTTTVNLRSGNGTQYPIIDVLRVNTYLTITGQFGDWRHVKIVTTEKEGWVHSDYIS